MERERETSCTIRTKQHSTLAHPHSVSRLQVSSKKIQHLSYLFYLILLIYLMSIIVYLTSLTSS